MKKIILLITGLSLQILVYTQTPTTCFEIESILVDACGSPEGENEMVRFVVGPTDLNVANLTISWASSNPYLGICQNATTAAVVAALNSTIQSCGYLVEPTAGVLPAGSEVLLITSTAVDVAANSFSNLNDTLIVIFQCAGNTAGHFANYNSTPGIRTLTMSFGPGCSDQVSYDRSLLINQNGTYGGSSAIKNGGRVDFDWSGTPTYANDGCQAPINPSYLFIVNNDTTICPGTSFALQAAYSSDIVSIKWESLNGSAIGNPFSSPANYTNNTAADQIVLTGYTFCNDSIKDTLNITIVSPITVQINASTNDSICAGQSSTLTATGADSYLWNTGATSASISASTTNDYIVIGTSACYTDTDTFHLEVIPLPTISVSSSAGDTICNGQSTVLTATASSPSVTWNTGQTGNTITVSTQGMFTASITDNICGTFSDSIFIYVQTAPAVNIQSTDTSLCSGNVILTATASNYNNINWNTGAVSPQISVSDSGWYWVSASNNCFTVSDSVYIYPAIIPAAQIITGDSILCNNENIVLSASATPSNVSYWWNTGETTAQITVSSGQQYYVVVSNSCGSDTAYQTIYDKSVIADFTTSTDMGEAPLDVECINLSNNATQYSWYIDNQLINNNTDFSTTFENQGTYIVTLIAENNFGCIDSLSKIIDVSLMTTVYIPNVFTPNGDGLNDVFFIKGNNILRYTFSIFNRWGELLFEGDEQTPWDGTYQNETIPDGTYVYIVKVTYTNDTNEIFTGDIQKLK